MIMRRSSPWFALCWLILAGGISATADKQSPNILFIAIDDLNDWTGTYGGHQQAKTPNLDRLAARGLQFSNAHCQAPICGPSRNSLLTGVLPSTSGLYFLKPLSIRATDTLKDAVTLPHYFLQHGYKTMAAGKVGNLARRGPSETEVRGKCL